MNTTDTPANNQTAHTPPAGGRRRGALAILAKETAIYGLSSIVGRFLNYLLVPLYTAKIAAASGGYGIITNVYAYTALLLVLLTYGMETAFFRYANKEGQDPARVYSTTLISVACTSLLFIILVLTFIHPIARAMGYTNHPAYIAAMAVTVALDAFQAIPFAYLRYQKRAIRFASLKLLFIILNIALNLVYFLSPHPDGIDAGYVFYINLLCTAFITILFIPQLRGFPIVFDRSLWRQMLAYAWPILLLGIAGILNQTADKILYPFLDHSPQAHSQLGIYGAASKIAMIMAMITQAFRYAYEPFVFSKARERDSRQTYALAMKYFIIFTLLAFLAVSAYLDILKYIIGSDYWTGLRVVPIVMTAEILMGIYFNLSFWYKLIDQTYWGAVFSAAGCLVLILGNILFVPRYGYIACAWSGVAGYATATILSFTIGQQRYPIRYPLRSIAVYALIAALFFTLMQLARPILAPHSPLLPLAFNTLLILLFIAHIAYHDLRSRANS